ncbi:MAG TPA: cyclic nucleotide-binding domain-containing protein [Solimonas sp.]|nr:cyclic nucleotide-binding domain-containing protein [Solimonas sp.]
MSDAYRIAIIGSGPAGLSAACRAAEMGDRHILLEAQPHLANTIERFQKGKHVMAEPQVLPLRSPVPFEAGTRENILEAWRAEAKKRGVNLRLKSEVRALTKTDLGFKLTLADNSEILAQNVVLSIGVQGNVRKLGAPGEDLPLVQYQLDDPKEYANEVIVVVGAGDAAIENAVALAEQNTVHIVNRKNEFSRAKDGNNTAILAAIEQGRVRCHYDSAIDEVIPLEAGHASGRRMTMKLNSKDGVIDVACDRIIARLGAAPPREFVESCGVKFASIEGTALPSVSAHYESNVPGLYIIGALAGYPLIKQAMNQGHEVVEFICQRPVEPADEPLLRERFAAFVGASDVDTVLDVLRMRSPVLSALSRLQLREFLLESHIESPRAGEVLYKQGDYSNAVFIVLSGEMSVVFGDLSDPEAKRRNIRSGRVFGEMALISGRPRSAAVVADKDSVLLGVPRRAMLKLIASNEPVRKYMDRTFAVRALQTHLAPDVEEAQIAEVVALATLRQFKAKETLYANGEAAEFIYLIRSGSVTLSAKIGERDVVLSYMAAGQYVGELDVIAGTKRAQTARASVKTEVICIPAAAFLGLMAKNPGMREQVRGRFREQIEQRLEMERSPERGAMMQFLLQQGLGEATDALLIDEALCIRCDQCEKACASTHGNLSRLDREAGATFDNMHVPTSCRHCEHPHCMKECPPDAIHRAANGEVFIDHTCIGCGNCERNCPYGVIQMGAQTDAKPSLWKWLLLGTGHAPGDEIHDKSGKASKKAVKCDMCRDRPAGPACVQACPTGAAIRVSPEQIFQVIAGGGR